jgi:hypothetical protein
VVRPPSAAARSPHIPGFACEEAAIINTPVATTQRRYRHVIFLPPEAKSAPFACSVAIAALLGATMLAGPLTAARADTATKGAIQLASAAASQSRAAAGVTQAKGETVEQRITDLHAALKITRAEDAKRSPRR